MTARYEHTDTLRGALFTDTDLQGARFTAADLTGARFRDCNLRRVKILSAVLVDVSLSGDIARLVVNDVDVTDFVAEELDRRHPERLAQPAGHTAGRPDLHRARPQHGRRRQPAERRRVPLHGGGGQLATFVAANARLYRPDRLRSGLVGRQ